MTRRYLHILLLLLLVLLLWILWEFVLKKVSNTQLFVFGRMITWFTLYIDRHNALVRFRVRDLNEHNYKNTWLFLTLNHCRRDEYKLWKIPNCHLILKRCSFLSVQNYLKLLNICRYHIHSHSDVSSIRINYSTLY